MASAVLDKFLEEVAKLGGFIKPSDDLPNLLKAGDALKILRSMNGSSLAVVGGDVWGLLRSRRYEIKSDWFSQKEAGEPAQRFIQRSFEAAIHHLTTVEGMKLDEDLVDLVVRDGITGESLGRQA